MIYMLQETLGELAKTEQRAWDVELRNGSGDFFNIDLKTITNSLSSFPHHDPDNCI